MTGDRNDDRKGSIHPPFYGPAAKARGESLPSIDLFLDELPLIDEFSETAGVETKFVEPAFPDDPYYAGFDDDYSGAYAEEYDTAFPLLDETADAGQDGSDYPLASPSEAATPEQGAAGWASGEWQRYDWSSISSLGRQSADRVAADEEWGATEWSAEATGFSGDLPRVHAGGTGGGAGPTAHDVAFALDDIARRIRSGELLIDQFRGSPPEAAMAAVLAALLRTRS